MNLNSENKQAIHDVLITDIQKRLYEDGKGTSSHIECLTEDILHTNSIADINNVLCDYDKLFPSEYLTLDGTLNYVIALLVSEIDKLEQLYNTTLSELLHN
jgi:hypothetical protein